MAKKPYITKRGEFLMMATYPLPYKGFSKPIRKSKKSLESTMKKGYMVVTKNHADSEKKFRLVGETRDFHMVDKVINGKNESELYSKEISLCLKDISDFEEGVYGFSPDFVVDPRILQSHEGKDCIELSDEATEYTTIALVKSPRHLKTDIDFSNLKSDMARAMFDSSTDDLENIEDIPILIVGNTAIALQDSSSCDIISTTENFEENNEFFSKFDIKQIAETVTAKVMSAFGKGDIEKNSLDRKKEINMDRKELEEILDQKLNTAFGDKFETKLQEVIDNSSVKMQDSADVLTSKTEELVEGIKKLIEGATQAGSAPEEPITPVTDLAKVKEELEKLKLEAQATKEENTKLKVEIAEQERLVQTIKANPTTTAPLVTETGAVTLSDEGDKNPLGFLDVLNKLELYKNGNK